MFDRGRRRLVLAVVLGTWLAAGGARADIQTKGAEIYPGKSEVSVHLGFQQGIGGYSISGGGPPGGFKLNGDYSYRVWEQDKLSVWINAGFGFTLAPGCDRLVLGPGNSAYSCGSYANGDTFDILAGVKLKFKVTQIPLVPYARINLLVNYIFNRYCTDNGVGFGPRLAGGAKYFLTRNIGVGIETGFTFGAGIYSGAPVTNAVCFDKGYTYPAHNEFLATWDFLVGGEFAF